mmetsp:Transcript_26524/g.4636  ORF Transcript_26524/g.4636 Transcript_26524/m.4636 type:complete len:135 (+) Transcript_26524:3152-3556(+)
MISITGFDAISSGSNVKIHVLNVGNSDTVHATGVAILGLKVTKTTNTGDVIGIYDYTYDTSNLVTSTTYTDNNHTSDLETTIDPQILGARASYTINLKLTSATTISASAWDIIVRFPSIIDTIPTDISAEFNGS